MNREAIDTRIDHLCALNGGRITAEIYVEDARSADSPLHETLEWDNDKAAHEHRINQARAIIASVRVRMITESRVLSTIAYVRDPTCASDEQGYASVLRLRTDRNLAQRALLTELRRAQALMDRAVELADALDLKAEIVGIRDRIVRMREVAAV